MDTRIAITPDVTTLVNILTVEPGAAEGAARAAARQYRLPAWIQRSGDMFFAAATRRRVGAM